MRPTRTPDQRANYQQNAAARAAHANERCEADGLHHPDCPGRWEPGHVFVTHHVVEFTPGVRAGVPIEVLDDPSNLRFVWNGLTGLGAGGCHGRIGMYSKDARDLGLLADPDTLLPEETP